MSVKITCIYKRPDTSIDWRPSNPEGNTGTWVGYISGSARVISDDGLTMTRILTFGSSEHFTNPILNDNQKRINDHYMKYLKDNNIIFTYTIE